MKKIGLFVLLLNLFVQQAQSQCTFGNFPPVSNTPGGFSNGLWFAKKYTLPSTATLTGLGLNSSANTLIPYRMAIYTDNSNTPGNFIAATNVSTITVGQNAQNLSSTTVIPGGDYWILAFFDGSSVPLTYTQAGTANALYMAGAIVTVPGNNSASWTAFNNYIFDFWAVINTPSLAISGPTAACQGSSVTLTASGASTYTWNTGATTPTILPTPSANTTYTVSGTGSNGCMGSITTSLAVNATPTINFSNNFATCTGSPLSQTLTGVLTHTWSTGSTTNTWQPTASGIYSVSGTDANGCVGIGTESITVFPLPTLTISGTNSVCAGSSVIQTVSGATTYSWSTGATTNTVSLSPATNTGYTVTGTDFYGCINSISETITVNALPTLSITGGNSLCAGSSLTQTISGASTYSWSNGATTNTVSLSPATNTVYAISGTDANGCTANTSRSITVNALPTLTVSGGNTICAGSSLTQTVSGATTYSWSSGATGNTVSLSPATTTVYTINGTDVNGCIGTSTRSVTVNALPTLTISGSSSVCIGLSLTQTLSGATTYSWSTGVTSNTISLSPATTTVLTASGTNTNGCTGLTSKTITVNSLPILTVSGTNTICAGLSATQTVSGAATYSWNNGATTNTLSISPAGTTSYSVSGISASGCAGAASVTITVNPLPTITIAGSNTICTGTALTLTASGAVGYLWNSTTSTTVLSAAPTTNTVYSVNGTDLNGCTNTANVAITVNSLPTITIAGNTTVCANQTLTLSATGASVYAWNTNATTPVISVSPATNAVYSVNGIDLNGCANSASVSITANPLPALTIAGSTTYCPGAPLSQTVSGAVSYSWSMGATTSTLVLYQATSTVFTVTGTDANGCMAAITDSITIDTPPVITAALSNTVLCIGETGTINVTGAVVWAWDNNSTAPSMVVSPTITTTYTVAGFDLSGCRTLTTVVQPVSDCTGIKTQSMENLSVIISPNPGNGLYTLNLSGVNENATLEIYTTSGLLIKRETLNPENTKIDLTDAATGLYYVTVRTGKNTRTIKLIKE